MSSYLVSSLLLRIINQRELLTEKAEQFVFKDKEFGKSWEYAGTFSCQVHWKGIIFLILTAKKLRFQYKENRIKANETVLYSSGSFHSFHLHSHIKKLFYH